jgi:autotransporter-associated beta strand protein
MPAVALGVSFYFAHANAWAVVCNGNPVINTNVTTSQTNALWLCSFTVSNTGSISTNASAAYPIYNFPNATITTLTNNGTISTSGATTLHAIANRQSSTITTLNNNNTIRTSSDFSSGIVNYDSSIITTLNNSNSGVIGTSGTSAYGIYNVMNSIITTLNNTGSIVTAQPNTFGVYNESSSTITTLNNRQGASSSALTYIGRLPSNYNVIIYGAPSAANFGKLSATSVTNATGTSGITFNIYGNTGTTLASGIEASTIAAGTYNAVLTGLASGNIVSSSLSGTYTGGYTWQLVNNSGTTTWNLVVTGGPSGGSGGSSGSPPADIASGTSVSLSSIGVTANPVLAGGTLVLSNGNSSSISIAITSAGGTIQAPSSGSAVLSGVFSGSGGLTFTTSPGTATGGTGSTIVLSGANTYSGGTTVSGGTLVVAGPSPTGTGDVFVASAGTLMGTGTIAGNGLVSGVLKPGNSPGYLSFTQNLTLNAGSTYQQDIAGATQASSATPVGASGYYSFVNVGSQLIITSGATLTPRLANLFSASEAGYGSSIYVPVLGDKFRIITAGGITGRFTTLTQPAELSSGTQFIAFYNVNSSNSLDLVTVPTSYGTTLSSSTTNAKSVASVLDQLLGVNKAGTASSAQDSLLYSVAGQSAANLPDFARSLAGEIHAASVATLPQTTQRVQQSVLARLGDYPMAPSQLNPALNNALLTGGISATNPSGLPTANMSSNPAVNPNAVNVTSAAVSDGRAWGEIAYQRAERASNGAGNGYNSNLYQIVTGVDAYSNAELGLKLGGGLALSNTTVSATGGNSTIQQGSLFVYGKMSVLQDYVLDGMASLGMSSTNLSRNDPTGYTGGFSSKAVLGNDALVSVGLSRAFEYNDVRVTPYARLTYQYVGQNSYDEGSGAAALNIARFSGSAVRGVIGVAAGSLNKDPLKDDYTYRANVAVGADTSGLLNPTLNTTLGGYSNSVTTATAGSAFVQVGLYGTVKIADNAYAYAGVSGEARSGQTLYGGSVGLRIAF